MEKNKGVVVCVDPRAAETGAIILEAGGNAFDAAVAVAFVQSVVLPFSCGLGGFMSANLWSAAKQERLIIDGCLRAGSRVTADMWAADYRGEADFSGASQFDDHRSDIGYSSICTPGTVAALAELHHRFGSLPWANLLQSAIDIARQGYPVTPELRYGFQGKASGPYHLDWRTRLQASKACAEIFLTATGDFPDEGELIRNPDYANALERLAQTGPDDFYRGGLAETMSRDLQDNGAYVTHSDFRHYRINSYTPKSTSYYDYQIYSNGAPGGGPLLLEAINVLEGLQLGSLKHSGPEYLSYLGSTLQMVNQDRRDYLGDPEVIGSEPGDLMISKARAAQLREAVLKGVVGGQLPPAEEPDTTHLTVVDKAGNIASITHSLGAFSGVVTPGLGFIYNNGMNRFDPRPNRASSLAPGKARLHLMMPAIVFKAGRPVMAFGAPGGNVILSALVQVFINVVEFGMGAVEAVYAPRIHAEGSTVWAEARIRTDVCDALRERDFTVVHQPASLSAQMARAQLALIGPDGQLAGASDPRAGSAVVYA